MGIYVITHIVEKGETLEDIAAIYGIPDVRMLFSFHHLYVPENKNHLGKVLYEGQEIFVPTRDDIEKMIADRDKRRQENFDRKLHKLRTRTFYFPFFKTNYNYLVTIKDAGSENVYTMSLLIEYFNKNDDDLYPLRIHQSEIKCNNTLPNLSVEIMASEVNKTIFPLEIYVNKKGLVEKINRIYDFRKKFKRNKSELEEFFEGEVGAKLIEQISYEVSDSITLSKYLNSNILWAILLRGRVGNYKDGICEKEMRLLNDHELFPVKNMMQKNVEIGSKYYYISQEIRKKEGFDFQLNVQYKQDIEHDMLEEAEIDLHNGSENIHITIKKTQI